MANLLTETFETTEDLRLVQTFHIPCYCTDKASRLKPTAFMDYAQELGMLHAEVLGFGYDDLQKVRTAWVLSRMHIHMDAYPLWRERIEVRTWHKGAQGPLYLRDFQLRNAAGEVMMSATTSWVILNIDTRRISRDGAVLNENTACHDDALTPACGKVVVPKNGNLVKTHEHVVSYSDADINGHTNNVRYLVWAMDMLDPEKLLSNPLKDIRVNFIHETLLGETVVMNLVETETASYVEGKVGDATAFCIEFK